MLASQNVKKDNTLPQSNQLTPVPPPSGTWFVILGSYQKYESEKANQRLQYIQGLGYSANILDTNNYPKLAGGLWIVAMGPYSKTYARSLAVQVKSKGAEAYIKAGW